MASRLDVDLALVRGSGPNGMILRGDVTGQAGAAHRTTAPAPASNLPPLPPVPAGATVTPLRGPAAALTGYMEQSLTIPTATASFRTLLGRRARPRVAANSWARSKPPRARFRGRFRSRTSSTYALVRTASGLPFITYSFRRDEKNAPQRIEPGIHLGLAVDSERKDGTRFLVVPVIKNAGELDFARFRQAYEDVVVKARDNKLGADDLQGASFTLTNPGGHRNGGFGATFDGGARCDFGGRRDRLSARFRGGERTDAQAARHLQDHADDEHLRSPRDPRCPIRRIPAPRGSRCWKAKTASTKPSSPRSACRHGGESADVCCSCGGAARRDRRCAPAKPSDEMLRAGAAGRAIVSADRRFGHLAAHLDTRLGAEPVSAIGLARAADVRPDAGADRVRSPASVLRVKVPGNSLAEVLPHLKETYSSTIAYEFEHISTTPRSVCGCATTSRSGKNKISLSPERQIEFLQRLTKVDGF